MPAHTKQILSMREADAPRDKAGHKRHAKAISLPSFCSHRTMPTLPAVEENRKKRLKGVQDGASDAASFLHMPQAERPVYQ